MGMHNRRMEEAEDTTSWNSNITVSFELVIIKEATCQG